MNLASYGWLQRSKSGTSILNGRFDGEENRFSVCKEVLLWIEICLW